MRQEMLRRLGDPRRDIDRECGYPATNAYIPVTIFQDLYDREALANRVVEVFPKETWQVSPEVYEDEDPNVSTPFEEAWDNLTRSLLGESSYQDEAGSPVWEILERADIQSGIGQFGIILIGIDDGKPMNEPVTLKPRSKPVVPLSKRKKAKTQPTVPGMEGAPTGPPIPGKKPPFPQEEAMGGEEEEIDEEEEVVGNLNTLYPNDQFGTQGMIQEKKYNPTLDQEIQAVLRGEDPDCFPKRKLLYLRVFPETLVQVTQSDGDITSPRFGQPIMYQVTLNDPRQGGSTGIGLTTATVNVHWSRVIHIADNRAASEVYGVPRCRPVLNRLLDTRKIYGADGEAYWLNCMSLLALSTHPQLGGDVNVNMTELRDQMEQLQNGLQRFIALQGMQAQSISPTISDPTNHLTINIEAICIQLGIPIRIFKGSERGELASSQDDAAWNDRIKKRQVRYVTPRIVIPFIDRLISMEVLPEPCGFSVTWDDITSTTEQEKTQIAQGKTAALVQYISGGAESLVPPMDFLTELMGFTEEKAAAMLEAGAAIEEQNQIDMMMQQQDMIDQGLAPDPSDPAVIEAQNVGKGEIPEGLEDAAEEEEPPPFVKNEEHPPRTTVDGYTYVWSERLQKYIHKIG